MTLAALVAPPVEPAAKAAPLVAAVQTVGSAASPVMAGSIVVDTNAGESALYEALVRRFDGAVVQRRKLDVGDVMMVAESGTVVVERKTWLDWAKSMTDGRYASQKARLRSLLAAPAEEEQEEEEEGVVGGRSDFTV